MCEHYATQYKYDHQMSFLGLINIPYSFVMIRQHVPVGDCQNTYIHLDAL